MEHKQNPSTGLRPVGAPAAVPEFAPVPVRARRDGWTPERQRAFIAALAEDPCIDRAARAVGLSRESAYRLCRRPGAAGFADAWSEAVARKSRGPDDPRLLWHRAFHGVVRPIVRGGAVVGARHQPDNAALLRLANRQDQADRARKRMRRRAVEAGDEISRSKGIL